MGDALMLHRNQTGLPKFTYTGTYVLEDDGNQNWRIKLTSNGTLTFQHLGTARRGVDIFIVGGGGRGQAGILNGGAYSWAGGGSGYVNTYRTIPIKIDTGYSITIGTGATSDNTAGKPSKCVINGTTYQANGGAGGRAYVTDWSQYDSGVWWHAIGGNGGSGGGSSTGYASQCIGGTNGGNGSGQASGGADGATWGVRGTGQGGTYGTREFGEANGAIYAQGGGNNTSLVNNSGNGGHWNLNGSSGIVVIRNARI